MTNELKELVERWREQGPTFGPSVGYIARRCCANELEAALAAQAEQVPSAVDFWGCPECDHYYMVAGVVCDCHGRATQRPAMRHVRMVPTALHGSDDAEWRREVCDMIGLDTAAGARWSPAELYEHLRELERRAGMPGSDVVTDEGARVGWLAGAEYLLSVSGVDSGDPDERDIACMKAAITAALAAGKGESK